MNSAEEKASLQVLVVEDNPTDAFILKMSLKEAGLLEEPTVADDGSVAIALLRKDPPFEDAPDFELIILDLNLRLVDGPQVLNYIRADPEFADITVAVLSSSPEDVMRSRAAQANCFFRKASALDAALEVGKKILQCFAQNRSS